MNAKAKDTKAETPAKPADEKAGAEVKADAAAQTQSGAVATQTQGGVPAAYDYGDDAGTGFEGAGKDDFLIPILDILHLTAPEVVNQTIPGAKAGMFVIRALGMVFDGNAGLDVVFCARNHKMNEWKTKDDGGPGGFVASHDPEHPDMVAMKKKQPFGKIKVGTGPTAHEFVETFGTAAILLPDKDTAIKCFIPFASTKIPQYKSMMLKADGVTFVAPNGQRKKMPLFGHVWTLKSRMKQEGSYTWFMYQDIAFKNKTATESRIDPASDLYAEARDFSKQFNEGLIKEAVAQQDVSEGAAGGPGGPTPNANATNVGGGGEEGKAPIPF